MSTRPETAKHTPGPWKVGSDGRTVYVTRSQGFPDQIIASTARSIYGDVGDLKANARLIAAAPELYKVVKLALKASGAFGHDENGDMLPWAAELSREARAAIAKAEGSAE